MTHNHEHHGRSHGHGHRTLWLGPGIGEVHRVGRRQFLTDLGRGAFAIAVIGGVAACSGDDDSSDSAATTEADTESGDAATAAPPPSPTSTPAVTSTGGDLALQWAQVGLGSVSAYVLVRGNEAAIVDTGSSGSADSIGAALATLGVTFDDVNNAPNPRQRIRQRYCCHSDRTARHSMPWSQPSRQGCDQGIECRAARSPRQLYFWHLP